MRCITITSVLLAAFQVAVTAPVFCCISNFTIPLIYQSFLAQNLQGFILQPNSSATSVPLVPQGLVFQSNSSETPMPMNAQGSTLQPNTSGTPVPIIFHRPIGSEPRIGTIVLPASHEDLSSHDVVQSHRGLIV
ncbi:hypothetical protein K439DRAFT_1611375 [Ramaria rubella]|nr:hypothetical protein K439DRAFT_1611375 [Ramaria rubella]